jgi:uncharacterized protein YycO
MDEFEYKSPQPGDFGLSQIPGRVGWWVGLGQFIIGDASRWTHAFIVLDDNTVIQAMPRGAEIVPLDPFRGRAVFSDIPLTDAQRAGIVKHARTFEGVKYGFSDYLALALANIGLHPKWLKNYIAKNGRMICSQLVDEAYKRADVHLFNDGRMPQDVTPGDLANLLIEREWIKY